MDYKAVLQECKSRAELYRGSDAVWNLTHEENCITAITDLLARADLGLDIAGELVKIRLGGGIFF